MSTIVGRQTGGRRRYMQRCACRYGASGVGLYRCELAPIARRAGRVAWRISLCDGERDWERLRNFGLYADVARFEGEIIFELDEGIDGETFAYSEADEQGIRWVD